MHGGPGAPGTAGGLALGLSQFCGVLEPLQSRLSLRELLDELTAQLQEFLPAPCVLIGHSFGAWLCAMLTAEQPELIRKLILVGCGPLERRLYRSNWNEAAAGPQPQGRRRISPPGFPVGGRRRDRLPIWPDWAHWPIKRIISRNYRFRSQKAFRLTAEPTAPSGLKSPSPEIRRAAGCFSKISCPIVLIQGETILIPGRCLCAAGTSRHPLRQHLLPGADTILGGSSMQGSLFSAF